MSFLVRHCPAFFALLALRFMGGGQCALEYRRLRLRDDLRFSPQTTSSLRDPKSNEDYASSYFADFGDPARANNTEIQVLVRVLGENRGKARRAYPQHSEYLEL